jgi:hypothetical protein
VSEAKVTTLKWRREAGFASDCKISRLLKF